MKKVLTIMVIMAFAVSTSAFAGDLGQKSKDAARDVVNYTGNVANDSANIVGNAAKGTGETAVSPFRKLWDWARGKGKGSEIVSDPINKAGGTVRDATVDTAKMPYEAGKKTASQR